MGKYDVNPAPKTESRVQGILRYLCNRQEGTCLERTPGSWARLWWSIDPSPLYDLAGLPKAEWCVQLSMVVGTQKNTWDLWNKSQIGLFYLVFYACLAGFFSAMLMGFFTTIPDKEPRLQDWESLIKMNPGMSFRPQPDVSYTLISFAQGEPDTWQKYVDNIEKYLEGYQDDAQEDLFLCDPEDPAFEIKDRDLACKVPLSNLGTECDAEHKYGYSDGRPCVLLKLNKMFNWEPEPFSNGSVPEELGDRYNENFIGVTCEGYAAADKDNIGPLKYFPDAGFEMKYFPYRNQPGYLAPVAMVQFQRLRLGTLVQVWCKAWADNIYHDRTDRAGSVNFEIMMD